MLDVNVISSRTNGLAIEVHRTVGPCLREHVYREYLCMALEEAGIPFKSEATLPG